MATRVRRVQLDASSSSDDEKPVAPRQLGDARERLSASSSSASSLSHSRAAAPAPVSSQPAASRQQPRVASASTTSSTALSASTSRAPTPQKQSRAADSAAAPTTTTRAVAPAPRSPASSLAETGDKPLPLPVRKSSALVSSSAAASASHPVPAGVKTSATMDSSPSSSLSSTTSDITPALATAPPSQSAPRRPSAPVLRRLPSPGGSTGTDNATNTAVPLEPTSQRRAEAPSAASGFNFGFRKPEDAARPSAESKHTAPVPPPSFGPSGAHTRAPLATAVAITEPPTMPPSAAAALSSRAATTAGSTTPVRERRAESVRRGLSSLFPDETPTPKAERLPPPPPSRSEAPGLSRLFDIKARADVGAGAAAPPLETALDAEAHARIAVRRLKSGTPSSSSSSSTSASPRVRPQVTKQATSSAHFEDESSSECDDDEADVRSGLAARNAEQKWHVGAGGVNRHAERAQLSAPVDASPPPKPPLTAATTTPTSASLAPTQFNRVFVAPRGGGGTSEGSSGWGRIGVPMARPRHPPHTHKANRTDAEEDEGRGASGRRASAPKVASATDGALFTSEGGRVTLDDTRLTRKRTSMTTRLASIEPARPDPVEGSAAAVAAALSLPTNSSASPSVRGTEQMTSVDGLEDGGRSGSSTPPPPPSLASPMDQEESATAREARLAAVKTTAMKVRRLLEPRLTIVGDADAANTQPQPLNLYSHAQTKNATTALSDWLLVHPLSATNTIIRTGNESTQLWAPQTGAVKGSVDGSDVWFRHTPLGYAACSTSQAQSEARARRAIQRRCGATAPKPSHAARPTLTPAEGNTANAGAPPRACAKEAIPWTSTWRDAVLTAQLGAPARISVPIGHHNPAASTPTTRVTVHRHHRKPREASALLFGDEVGETEQASPLQRAHFSSRRDDGAAGRTLESDVAYNVSSAAPNTGTASALDGKGPQSSLFRAPPTWRTRGTSATRAGPGGEASAWLSSSWAAAPPPPPPATAVASQSSRSPSGVDTPPRPARPAATMVRRDPGHGAEDAAAPQRTDGTPKSKGAA